MLKQLIHDKINEIFAEYQKANNIISGDIDPLDWARLEIIQNDLAETIKVICAKQPKAKEFNFISRINQSVPMYHAVETEDGYVVASCDGCGPWSFSKKEMHDRLLKGDWAIVAETPNYDDFTPSWYIYTDSEGIAHSETFSGDITENQFFTKVSKRICFDDCTDETVHKIYYKGKEVYYAGWQPCMKYEYKDRDGNTVWVGYFEHWDH